MIIVAFKPLDYRKQAAFTPLILRVDDELMNKTVHEVKVIVHAYFRQYLSPFINENNLNLSNKQSQSMINDIPFYMYLDQNQFTQYILCTTKPNIKNQAQLRWKYISNSLVFIIQNQQEIFSIPQKEIATFDEKLKNICFSFSKQNSQIIANSSIIKPNNDTKWSQIFNKNWKDLVHHNDCIYIKVCPR